MIVEAKRFVRKMRGGAQAFLMECNDGHYYVVKTRNNPQHHRILVNEWIASALLTHVGIATPAAAIVNIDPKCLAENPELRIELGSRSIAVEPGPHFGSRYPGEPGKVRVYDFIPDLLLDRDRVANFKEFFGVLAFDKWIGNVDTRQAVFVRPSGRKNGSISAKFEALMIDHGYAFDGPHWGFCDSPLQGLYFRTGVYEAAMSLVDFEPWLERIMEFPAQVLADALERVPAEWLTPEDKPALERLLERLLLRRRRVPDLIVELKLGRCDPFPRWLAA